MVAVGDPGIRMYGIAMAAQGADTNVSVLKLLPPGPCLDGVGEYVRNGAMRRGGIASRPDFNRFQPDRRHLVEHRVE
jgi:hypothetical protein